MLGYGAGITVATSLAKIIPGVGWMIGMASLPLVAGATTYAIGKVFAKHYAEGGSMFDLSASNMRNYYQEQFENGKQMAEKAKAEIHTRKAAAAAENAGSAI